MSLAQALSTYLTLNFLILIGFFALRFFAFVSQRANIQLQSKNELTLHYAVLLVIISFTMVHPLLPQNTVFSPTAKVWSAPSMKSFGADDSANAGGGYLSLPTPQGTSTIQVDQISTIWIILTGILFLLGGFFISRDIRSLVRIKNKSYLVKKSGRTQVYVSDYIQVPFSYWLPGEANIIIPSGLLQHPQDYRMAVSHEIQHHRQGDTRWVYVLLGFKGLCFFNPAIYFWNRWISEIQEFACDETLVDQGKVDSQAYARCLVEVAQTAINQKYVPVCATGLTFLIERNLLKRRIEKMFTKSSYKKGSSMSLAIGLFIASIMGATAYGSKGLIQDRRVNMAQAQAMAIRAQSETGFPVVVNDLVLKQLNRYIGTPEGREFMRDSLTRMENYKSLVEEHLETYKVPTEILALPIIESGYQNLPQSENSMWPTWKAAGLWQFIPQTARVFGLRVDEQKDERLDVTLLTDAAMRYLQSNNLRFKDWQLAVLSYNMGENAVQKAIDTVGSRDAWTLIRKGHEGDKNYLAKFMAAILIMRNPDSVR